MTQVTAKAWETTDWLLLIAVAAAALALRLVFFTGYFGSDEVTYTGAATGIAHGIWESSTYIGWIRYGVNIPVAFFLAVFGHTEFAANLWSLACSLAEILLVFWIGREIWGRNAAMFSSLLLAATPLHAHLAGRLMADAPLACFVTLSFVLLWQALRRGATGWFVAAGAAAGFVFWIKESVFFLYAPVLLASLIASRRWSAGYVYGALTAILVVVANSLLQWAVNGDPLAIVNSVQASVERQGDFSQAQTSPSYYAHYLLVDLRHSWLLGWLAAFGFVAAVRGDEGGRYVSLWGGGLLLMLSLVIVSFQPFSFVTKQTNYMLVFFAPLALLSGSLLAPLRPPIGAALAAIFVAGGVFLTALEQQAIQVFTANSKATVEVARRDTRQPVFGMTNAVRAANYQRLFAPAGVTPIIYELPTLRDRMPALQHGAVDDAGFLAYAVVDTETLGWGHRDGIASLDERPSCWVPVRQLQPTGFGRGRVVTLLLLEVSHWGPVTLGRPAASRLAALLTPRPAYLFGIPRGCTAVPGA